MTEFLPDLTVIAGFALASIILALTPGPDMTLFLSQTVAHSKAAGFASLVGATTGLVVHSILVSAGLSVLLLASAEAFTVLKVVGTAYLVYLAIDALRHGSSLSLGRKNAGPATLVRAFLKGLLIDLLNPKVIIFFVTFLPQFVQANDPHAGKKMLFLGLFYAVVNIPTCLPLIFSAERIAGLLRRSPKATRFVDWLFAGVLSAFALKLILTSTQSK